MQVADLLLQGGADVDKTGGLLKGTALHRATELNQPDLIEYLLRNGASLEIRDSQVRLFVFYSQVRLHYAWGLRLTTFLSIFSHRP